MHFKASKNRFVTKIKENEFIEANLVSLIGNETFSFLLALYSR